MKNNNIFVSELSTSTHEFHNYHFCRGNSNRRKTRVGLIEKGSGAYIYLGKKLEVGEGDVVFIPESIYCYSEWRGSPDIVVKYISCFINYDGICYEPQRIEADSKTREMILEISSLLSLDDQLKTLEAYSIYYRLLQFILPQMTPSNIAFDKTLQSAVEFITNNWKENFSVSDLAKLCCVSESTLYHLFQKNLGQTPVQFLNSIRINVAIEYLETTNYSISVISSLSGFSSENHFRKTFQSFTSTTPLKFRKSR